MGVRGSVDDHVLHGQGHGPARVLVGWCVGVVESANGDRRKKVDGDVVNFYVHYEIDGDTSAHALKLESYGGEEESAWVLLEEHTQAI